MSIIRRNLGFLQSLFTLPEWRKERIVYASPDQIDAVSELALNMLRKKNRLRLSTEDIKGLKKHKKTLRYLALRKPSAIARKERLLKCPKSFFTQVKKICNRRCVCRKRKTKKTRG